MKSIFEPFYAIFWRSYSFELLLGYTRRSQLTSIFLLAIDPVVTAEFLIDQKKNLS